MLNDLEFMQEPLAQIQASASSGTMMQELLAQIEDMAQVIATSQHMDMDEVVAQYALRGYDQPIGVSDYQLSKALPENLKSTLPNVEEMEEELTLLFENNK